MKKKQPEFKSESQERKFWPGSDSTEHLDWPSAKRKRLVRLKPSGEDEQLRSHRTASKYIGAIEGTDPHRSENASRIVREKLKRRSGQ
jgi:hypothetical protein